MSDREGGHGLVPKFKEVTGKQWSPKKWPKDLNNIFRGFPFDLRTQIWTQDTLDALLWPQLGSLSYFQELDSFKVFSIIVFDREGDQGLVLKLKGVTGKQ